MKKDTARVFITGYSALSASGLSVDEQWEALLAKEQYLKPSSQWDLSSWSTQLTGELPSIQPAKMLPDRKLLKMISRQDVLGIHAATQAVSHSQLLAYRQTLTSFDEFNDKTGVYVGSPGNKYYQQYDFLPLLAKTGSDMQAFAKQLFTEVHPMWLLRILPNNVLAYTGITFGFKGANHNITNHATGGMQAIIEAYHAIKLGQIDRAVVVAYDVATEPQALFYYAQLGVISANDLKPFDKQHDGTILADGAAALVLESEESVQARQATRYAEVVAGMAATEASGLFSVEKSGAHWAKGMLNLLSTHRIKAEDIGMVVAHGNGNPSSDRSEAQAIQHAVGTEVPVTSFKWSMGHTVCAAGPLDTVLATRALEKKCIPGIANFSTPAEGCESLAIQVQTSPMAGNKPYALVLNRGFASINTCLVLKAYD